MEIMASLNHFVLMKGLFGPLAMYLPNVKTHRLLNEVAQKAKALLKKRREESTESDIVGMLAAENYPDDVILEEGFFSLLTVY